MAEIGLYEEGRRKWLPYDEDTEVCIELLSKEQVRQINQKAAKAGKRAGEMGDKLLGRAAVKGWRKTDDHEHPGFMVKGIPFQFDQENLDTLMTRNTDFSAFVNKNCLNEDAFIEEDIEDSKNA
jgi:hypothetical protein